MAKDEEWTYEAQKRDIVSNYNCQLFNKTYTSQHDTYIAYTQKPNFNALFEVFSHNLKKD